MIDEIVTMVTAIDQADYSMYRSAALLRIASRDPNDWPIVATALLRNCPIWTEDQDFFGCGIATWTSDRVKIYLNGE